MEWSTYKKYKTVSTETNAPFYYLINPNTAIPKLGDSQLVLNSYLAETKQPTSFEFVEQYPILTKEQLIVLFPFINILGVELTIIKDHVIEPPKPSLVILSIPDDF